MLTASKIDYRVKQLYPRIFQVSSRSHVDLARLFLRFQEFYESPKFKGKKFFMKDYRNWYVKNISSRGYFTYASDWAGFNIPSAIVTECWAIHELDFSTDKTSYDASMLEIWRKCRNASTDSFFYLIGSRADKTTLQHEIAHGLFYVDSSYRNLMVKLVDQIPRKNRRMINKYLRESGGYDPSVYVDEIQAYMSEGDGKVRRMIDRDLAAEFSEIFNKFSSVGRSDKIVA